jgi:tetratricopeptide (TPR) repeat protein
MKRFCLAVLLFVLLAFPSRVRADIAPPYNPPGSNPQPGVETTQVRMVAETVLIEVQKDITPGSLGRAHVTADFTMHNLGSTDESMAARFPIAINDGVSSYPEISNLRIKVNGKQVQYRRTNYPEIGIVPYFMMSDMVPWAEFDITFPAGQDIPISVEYDLRGTGYYPYIGFYYVLETGAGWKDTIGSADIILRLPYEASPQNVVLDLEIGWATTTPGGVFQGNEVRWHFESFEPGWEQNMKFALVAPSTWQAVITARDNVAKHPNDGEAWGMLARAYKNVFQMNKGYRDDTAGLELYQLSVEAYEKCLSLKPDDAQWHAGFADLLANRAFWDGWGQGATPEAIHALNEIHTALELAPNDPVVREIAVNMTYIINGGIEQVGNEFVFPWLTQTPLPPTEFILTDESTATLPATSTPTETSVPQASPTRTDSPAATPTSAPQKSSPLCGSAALLPLVAVLGCAWNVSRKSRQ